MVNLSCFAVRWAFAVDFSERFAAVARDVRSSVGVDNVHAI